MIRVLFNIVILSVFAFNSWGAIRYETLDLSTRAVRMIYEIEDSKPGNKVFIFPTSGFIHDDTMGQFTVESVFDLSAKRELEFAIIRDSNTGLPQIKITYPERIRTGETKTIQVTVKVNMPEHLLQHDANGRYIFEYETSHRFEFIVPKDHYVVYTNLPVVIFEKGDQIVVQQLDTKLRKIIIQTRPMK